MDRSVSRREFLKTTASGVFVLSAGCVPQGQVSRLQKNGKAPNVVIVLIDDMGYGDLSCLGNPFIKTPHLDALHADSVRFTRFHVAPMCTPTRSEMMSGMSAMRTGARWVGTENTHLRTDVPILPEVFKKAGYATGLFGKWHLGDNYPLRPQDRGFDKSLWHPQQEIGTVNDYWGNDYFDDVFEFQGERQRFDGYCTDILFNEAMKWMKRQAESQKPFLCYIPTNVVHSPYYVPQRYRDRFDGSGLNKELETFVGMMINFDDNMGRLAAFLQSQGLDDNTIVIFTSDNGTTHGYQIYNAGMRGLKTMLLDGGHRVPLFVRWPKGGIQGGRDINELAHSTDIFPTLLELADIKVPKEARIEGQSLAKQIQDKTPMPDRILVVQFQRRIEIKKWDACILWGPWRLVNGIDVEPSDPPERQDIYRKRNQNYETVLELYNIEDDPKQLDDVIEKHPDVVAKMKAHYEQWWAKTEKNLDVPRSVVIGNDAENPTFLSATAWENTYFTQIDNVLDGRPANGDWNVVVDQDGVYEFAMRRWPKEADRPIRAVANIYLTDPYAHGPVKKGTALPIERARLRVGDFDESAPIEPEDKHSPSGIESLFPGSSPVRAPFITEENSTEGREYFFAANRFKAVNR